MPCCRKCPRATCRGAGPSPRATSTSCSASSRRRRRGARGVHHRDRRRAARDRPRGARRRRPVVRRLRGTKRASRAREVPIVLDWQRSLLAYALERAGGSNGGAGALERLGRKSGPDLGVGRGSGAHRGGAGGQDGSSADARRNRAAPARATSGLFAGEPDRFRWALRYACRRAGIDHVTPNDLRRTYATEMHAAGARLSTLAPVLGHMDTRMLERVYAVLPPALIAERLRAELGVRDTIGTDARRSESTSATGETPPQSETVPRGGIEPPTRGFSVHGPIWRASRETRAISASERSHRDRIGTALRGVGCRP
jgi:hypothetical protein